MNRKDRIRESRTNLNANQNFGQDEFLDENSLPGSRSLNDRLRYGSSQQSPSWERVDSQLEDYHSYYGARDVLADDRGKRRWRASTDRDYTGVGPRGYKRSDDRIEEEVCNILMKDRNIDASNIEVHVHDGIVTLSGTVETRNDKLEAEMAIEGVAGVEDIQNQIKLKKWGDYSDRPYQRNYADRNPSGERDKDTYY